MSDPISVIKTATSVANTVIKAMPNNSLPYGKLSYSYRTEIVNVNYLKNYTKLSLFINEALIENNIFIARVVLYNQSKMDIGEINKIPDKPICLNLDVDTKIIQVNIHTNNNDSFDISVSKDNELIINYSCIKKETGVVFDILYSAKKESEVNINGMLYQININKSDKSFQKILYGKPSGFKLGFDKWFPFFGIIIFGIAVPMFWNVSLAIKTTL
jgi:hypothetical protein